MTSKLVKWTSKFLLQKITILAGLCFSMMLTQSGQSREIEID